MPFGIDDALIAAGISAGGNLLGGMIGAAGQNATNAQQMYFNSIEAQKNREFQWSMGTTAYQRAMADMKLAGLNPILAGFSGGNASGGGAQASVQLGNPGASMQAGISSAAQAGEVAARVKQANEAAQRDKTQGKLNEAQETATKANEALTKELENKAKQDTATSAAQQHQLGVSAANTQADTVNKGIQALILSHDANTAAAKARIAKAEADQAEKYGPGTMGNVGGTTEKLIGRTIDAFRNPGSGGAITSPTDPRFWGMRGRDRATGAPPNEGLVIDMKRK